MYSVCILIFVCMYLYSYPSTHSISRLAAGCACDEFKVRLKTTMEWTQRYTPRPWLSEFGDVLGCQDRVNTKMHLEAEIDQVWRGTWRPWWSEFGDALGGRDRVNSEMHSDAVIVRVWWCSCRLWSGEIGGVLGGGWYGDGRWEARRVLMRLCWSVSQLETVGMWQGDYTFEAVMASWLVAVDL